jgi:hypothetical protein
MMRWLVLLLLLISTVACSPNATTSPTPPKEAPVTSPTPPKETPVTSPSPAVTAEEEQEDRTEVEPKGLPAPELQPHNSSIEWPKELRETKPTDRIVLNSYIGGVAGTDFDQISVSGDGTVTIESGRQGGPGGKESKATHQITAEQTRVIFERVRDSKLLDHTEHMGTVGATLTVVYNGQTDQVSVGGRVREAESVLSGARSAR